MSTVPFTTPAVWPDRGAGRLAARVRTDPTGCKVAILGLPDDLGVRLNGGRAGGAGGPAAFRAAFARYGVADPFGWDWPGVFDAGDVTPAEGDTPEALADTHWRVTEATKAVGAMGLIPVGIGGGHDLTFAFARGVIEYWKAKAVTVDAGVYFDAHLDVRENIGSGMAFRRLVEECGVKHLEARGTNPMVNAREHWRWFMTHGGVEGDGTATSGGRSRFVSVDLDVLDASAAPGVSAPNPAGWSVEKLSDQVRALGADAGVKCLDIMELNPAFDVDGRTARAAVHVFLSFLRGVAGRGPA